MWKGVDGVYLPQDRNEWWDLMNTVINLRETKRGEFYD
jgi:hypothetical protein